MNIIVKPNQMRGRIVKIAATKAGIILPSTDKRKESVLFLIEEVGSDVTTRKVGDIVIPRSINNVLLRETEFHILEGEEQVFCGIDGLSREQIEIEGEKRDQNGFQKDSFSVRT